MAAPSEIERFDDGMLSLNNILGIGLVLVFVFAALFAIYIIIRGGIQWSMSGGDKQKIEQARMRIVYGIMGLLLILFSFLIVNFVYGLFGLNSLS